MTIAFGTIGAKSAGGTTTVSIAMPASDAAGDMLVAGRSLWPSTATCTNEAGWTAGGDLGGGTGAAADAHTTKARIDYKIATGSDTDPTVFDQAGTPNGCVGICARYTKTAAAWGAAATATGDDATHGSGRSATASTAISFQPGDMLVAVAAVDTDANAGITAPAFTASGITFGTTTARNGGAGVTTGNDGNVILFDALVTAGTGTVAPTLAFTLVTTQCGPVSFLRLREAPQVAITAAAETDSALALTKVDPILKTIVLASETDTALAITKVDPIARAIGVASETDTALLVTPELTGGGPFFIPILTAVEVDSALTLTKVDPILRVLGIASETDTARPIGVVDPIIRIIGVAIETDVARQISLMGVVDINTLTINDLIQSKLKLHYPGMSEASATALLQSYRADSNVDDWEEYVAHMAGASAENNFVDDQYAFWDAFVA
jgi:hypothetical protein